MDPDEVRRIFDQADVKGDFYKLIESAGSHGLTNPNIAKMRKWKEICCDDIQEIIDSGRAQSEQQARDEYLIRQLMGTHRIDRTDASRAFEMCGGDVDKASEACI
jgi:hypothetical protein